MKNISRIWWTLIALDIFFIILHLLFGERFDLFHLDRERTFAAYYSGAKFVTVAALSVCVSLLSRTRFLRGGWIGVAVLFLSLGFDEISELHENITYYVLAYGAGVIAEISFFRTPTYNWLAILSPIILAAFIFLFAFSRALKDAYQLARRHFLWSLILFAVALGLELAGGLLPPVDGPFKLYVLEEFIELVAASVMIRAVLMIVQQSFQSHYKKIAS